VSGGNVLASARVLRDQIPDGVRREVVREDGLFGTLFVPPNDAPHPAVMLVSGSGGGLSEELASPFAAHGIAGFALAYFNYETLPKAIANISLEYFETGIEFLQAHPMIDSNRIAIAGTSHRGVSNPRGELRRTSKRALHHGGPRSRCATRGRSTRIGSVRMELRLNMRASKARSTASSGMPPYSRSAPAVWTACVRELREQ